MFFDGDDAHDDPSFGSGSAPQPLFENGGTQGRSIRKGSAGRNFRAFPNNANGSYLL
jgi:hypothetical protein